MKVASFVLSMTCALALGLAATPFALADYNGTKPPVYVKDSPITAKVKSALDHEKKGMHWGRIVVKTDDQNNVWLSGLVTTQEEADRAKAIAAGTEGVAAVKSDIQVKAND
jgi:osmotically-inducible protein OsmY